MFNVILWLNFFLNITIIDFFFLKKNSHHDEKVLKTLCFLRDGNENDPQIQEELEEIRQAARVELESRNSKWTELLKPNHLRRLFIGVWLQIFQQWTGTNAVVGYYYIYPSSPYMCI